MGLIASVWNGSLPRTYGATMSEMVVSPIRPVSGEAPKPVSPVSVVTSSKVHVMCENSRPGAQDGFRGRESGYLITLATILSMRMMLLGVPTVPVSVPAACPRGQVPQKEGGFHK